MEKNCSKTKKLVQMVAVKCGRTISNFVYRVMIYFFSLLRENMPIDKES